MSECIRLCDAADALGSWLYNWQTLLAALIAFVGAILTIRNIRDQISQADRHEHERLRRQHNAVRATLPLTLSGLIATMREMLLALNEAKVEVRRDGAASSFDPPPSPSQHIEELKDVIATTDEVSVFEPISEIIRQIQTLWARVELLRSRREQRRRAGLEQDINSWIMQSAEIHALVESLFEYARSETDQGPDNVPWERVESIIFQLGIEERALVDEIRRGLERSPDYWPRSQ